MAPLGDRKELLIFSMRARSYMVVSHTGPDAQTHKFVNARIRQGLDWIRRFYKTAKRPRLPPS